ncbi:MAG: hypothetical protein ACJAY8_000615 [Sphingobacteriales bacterium]|jgi:hypothetical protein
MRYKYILVFFLSLFTGLNSIKSQAVFDSLVAYYAMDDNLFLDSGPDSLHGQATNTTFLLDSGRTRNCHQFSDGSSVEIFNHNLNIVTYNIWFKLDVFDEDQRIFHNGGKGGSPNDLASSSLVFLKSGEIRFNFSNPQGGNSLILFSGFVKNPGVWNMATCTYDSTTMVSKLYLNGILRDSGIALNNMIASPEAMRLSYYYGFTPQNVKGMLDEFGIWSRVLSDTEIVEIYDGGFGPDGEPCVPKITSDSMLINTCDSALVHGEYHNQEALYSDTLLGFNGCDSISNIYLDVLGQAMDTIFTTINDTNYVTIEDTITTTLFDTVLVTVNDTMFTEVFDTIPVYTSISVTDTLVIYYSASSVNTLYGIDILVYPNPTSGIVTVDCGNAALISDFTFNITLGSGTIVFQSYFSNPKIQIPLANLAGPGYYFLNIFNGSGVKITTKVIVLQ